MSTARSPRGPYRNGIARRKQILAKAGEVFATYGYLAGSLRQIALEVGVSPAALTRHFDSKEDLLIEVLKLWGEETGSATAGLGSGIGYFEGQSSLMRYHLAHRGYLELFLRLSAEASNPAHPAATFIRERNRRTLELFISNLNEAIAAGDIAAMSNDEVEQECRLLISVMDGLELQWLLDPNVELVALFERHQEQMLARWRADISK